MFVEGNLARGSEGGSDGLSGCVIALPVSVIRLAMMSQVVGAADQRVVDQR